MQVRLEVAATLDALLLSRKPPVRGRWSRDKLHASPAARLVRLALGPAGVERLLHTHGRTTSADAMKAIIGKTAIAAAQPLSTATVNIVPPDPGQPGSSIQIRN